jgi:hypothetical protein
MTQLQNFLSFFKIFYGNMFVIIDELDHFEENFSNILQIFLSKRSDPDLVHFFRIRI